MTTFPLSGGYSSAWSADVNGEEKLKVENFFRRGSALKRAAISVGEIFSVHSVAFVSKGLLDAQTERL